MHDIVDGHYRGLGQKTSPHAAEAETIMSSLFRLCRQNATLDMSNGNINPPPLDTSTVTDGLLDAAVKANADPTRLVEIAKQLTRRYGFYKFDIHVDECKRWRIPYYVTMAQMVKREEDDGETSRCFGGIDVAANVGHLAWVPRRSRPARGHTQFDTRITFGPKMDAYTACQSHDTGHLKIFEPHRFNAVQTLLPGANNVAILVKLFLGLHLAEHYGNDDAVKKMVGVIDDSNRPVFVKQFDDASIRGVSVPPWQPYVFGAANGTHHIYTPDNSVDQAHCLYLASVGWPFWADVDFEQNLVPPQLAIKIDGIPGNNVVFVGDSLTKQSFGDKISLPSRYTWHSAIQWFAYTELAHEECCYAREIAARITFYWPEHAPELHHRNIPGIDAAALTTFFNSDLVLPRPHVGRSFLQQYCKPVNTARCDLWRARADTVLSLGLQEGIIYDNLVGRSIGYAQGCVAQRLCISTDSLLSVRVDPAPLSVLPRIDIQLRQNFLQMSPYEKMWYITGSRIYNFMPSSKSIELCYEAMSRARNAQNHHRLIDRLAHRLISSSQVLDIMAVMPDACYLGIGNIALSNIASTLYRSDCHHLTDTFFPKCAPSSGKVSEEMDHGYARMLANFARCLGVSTYEDRPTYYVTHTHHGAPVDSWQPLQVINDPVFIHIPEEATWTTFNETKLRRCFKIQDSNTNSPLWPTLISQVWSKINEPIVLRTGRICAIMPNYI